MYVWFFKILQRDKKTRKISTRIYVPESMRRYCTECVQALPHINRLFISPCLLCFNAVHMY